MSKVCPDQIQKSLKKWNRQSAFLQFSYVFLTLLAIVSSLAIPVFIGEMDEKNIRILSFVSALSVGIPNGFNLKEKSNEMRNAYTRLRGLITRFENLENYSTQELVDDYIKISDGLGEIKGSGVVAPELKITNQNK